MVVEKTLPLIEMTLSWHKVLPRDVYFHKNRTNQLQRGLDCLKPYNPARGSNVMLAKNQNWRWTYFLGL